MSEDRKKHLRTQGKYETGKIKSRDRRQKSHPAATEMKTHKKYSNEGKRSDYSFADDSISPVKCQENSDYSLEQEEQSKPIEIKESGKCTLSTTHNGESVVVYEPKLLLEEEADDFYDRLYSSISWYSKNIVINGEEYPQPRLVAWFGPYPYSYSGATLEPQDMPDCVLEIKTKVEDYLNKIGLNATFNSVLLNLYRNGKDSVAWHSDDESTLGICPTIASVSLGETRRFEMRPKKRYSKDENPSEKQAHYFVNLTHGSLLIMEGCMQEDWQHRVPKEYHDRDPRINLTFYTVYPIEKISHREPRREIKNEEADVGVLNKTPSSKIKFNDVNFPLLSSDAFPSSSHPSSGVKNESLDCSSDPSSRNDNLDSSCEVWDIEKVENDMPDNKVPSKTWLNVSAKEFVPKNTLTLPSRVPDYSKFPLEELLHYEIELMSDEALVDFPDVLKEKVLEDFRIFHAFPERN